jgi:hypothetical protein
MGCSWGNGMNSQLSWDIVDHNVEPHLKEFPQWGKPTSKRLAQEETMKSHGFLLDSMLVPMIKSWNIHLLDWHWIDIVGQFTLSKYTKGNIWIHRGESNMIHWLVSTYPSEKWWSESQLGWWNSQVNGKTCSKPPIRFFHNYWILMPNQHRHIHFE